MASNLVIPINSRDLGTVWFTGANLKTDYETGQVKVDAETGKPVYIVNLTVLQPDTDKTTTMTVSVPCDADPSTRLKQMSAVVLDGLRLMTGEMNGRKWVSFFADSVVPLGTQKQPAK